jgi:hypothetical protein
MHKVLRGIWTYAIRPFDEVPRYLEKVFWKDAKLSQTYRAQFYGSTLVCCCTSNCALHWGYLSDLLARISSFLIASEIQIIAVLKYLYMMRLFNVEHDN